MLSLALRSLIIRVLSLTLCSYTLLAQPYSSLVYPGPDGKLEYAGYANEAQTSMGNRVIDYSHAGYQGGGVAIPWVPVVMELEPTPGESDDFRRIQDAIDYVRNKRISVCEYNRVMLPFMFYPLQNFIRIRSSFPVYVVDQK